MKNSLFLPLAVAGQLLTVPAFAQGSGREVTILRMSGPQLGVRLVEVDPDAVTRLKLKEEKGALVIEVLKDSAAEKAGIKEDDVIVRFQGESILTAAQLSRLVRDVPSGRKVDIDLVRAGAPLKVAATIKRGERSDRDMEMPELADLGKRLNERMGELHWKSEAGPGRNFNLRMDEDGPGWMQLHPLGRGRLGVGYNEISGQLAKYFKAPGETAILVESVVEGSAAEKAGVKAGDLLIKLGGTAVKDSSDLLDAVRGLESGKATPLTVWRDGRSVDLSVTASDDPKTALRRKRPVS
jgi:serine protease Do